ncbi:MAG: UvrD-helicase domain-containing protein [Myxococcota bacterium]|nr:UvrD-helicase domain-containing protein [Myxococcota bacterium]
MNLRIITASAGSGKTWRLTQELDAAIASKRARPSQIVATTFTVEAAAELASRARSRLLQNGRSVEAQELLAARIGTVNAVCGSLVWEHAFELGVSPDIRVLDEGGADLELRRTFARVVPEALVEELDAFTDKFEKERDWRIDVRRIMEAARANALSLDQLAMCARRSRDELDGCLGPISTQDLDDTLRRAIAAALAEIATNGDETKGTIEYLRRLHVAAADFARTGGLAWGAWASLARAVPTKRSKAAAAPVAAIAQQHVAHPRLRADLHRLIDLEFEVAAVALLAYQEHKRTRGVIDLVDQESLALELLRRPDVRSALAGQIDLFLVDEFQDTSPIQLAVFLELAALASESIWVGDPKQAIYGFRGTDPALMDAAIESLSSVATDADLTEAAAAALGGNRIESLGTSYRSRPALVEVTSEIFARAFLSHGMPEERTRLVACVGDDAPELGPVLEHWPIDLDRRDGTDNDDGRAAAAAAGIRDLLARPTHVRDREARVCAATPRDIAILCRTNRQCRAVADALAALGVPAVMPRMGLLRTLEARVACAGLALWIDPFDSIARAELARVIRYPTDMDAFVAEALAAPGRAAFADDPTVAKILAARADLAPIDVIDALIAASDLRRMCAGWGDTAQRFANLDALRSHTVTYATTATAPSPAGLLHYLQSLETTAGGWQQVRADRQAVLASDDAVIVSTWHRAKGLEWPITVLFGLETMREPSSFGVHVVSDRSTFDAADPIGARWIRFWPNPYSTANQLGVVREEIEASPGHAALVTKVRREALRVLYVGWTRARDRLVLAATRGKLLAGVIGVLAAIDATLVTEPPSTTAGLAHVRWAGIESGILAAPARPAPAVRRAPRPGVMVLPRGVQRYGLARIMPSSSAPVACSIGEVVDLGPRIAMTGRPDMESIGDVVHAFFGADRALGQADRFDLARDVLADHEVAELTPADLVDCATRLWRWTHSRYPQLRIHREWPIYDRVADGAVVVGTADLVLADATSHVVIDHKTFPGTAAAAAERAVGYSGQLAAYATALGPMTATWLHFPIRGRIIEVRLAARTGAGNRER